MKLLVSATVLTVVVCGCGSKPVQVPRSSVRYDETRMRKCLFNEHHVSIGYFYGHSKLSRSITGQILLQTVPTAPVLIGDGQLYFEPTAADAERELDTLATAAKSAFGGTPDKSVNGNVVVLLSGTRLHRKLGDQVLRECFSKSRLNVR